MLQMKQVINKRQLQNYYYKIINNKKNMQIQRYLFRVSQKINTSSKAQSCWKLIYHLSLIVCLYTFCLLLIGQLHIKKNENHLTNCFISNNFTMKQDQFVLIYTDKSAVLMKQLQKLEAITSNNLCSIYKNLNYTNITQNNQLELSGLYSIYKMQKKQKQLLKFDNYTIILKNRSYVKDFIYGISVLISNQLISIIDHDKFRTMMNSDFVYVKSQYIKFYYSLVMKNDESFQTKVVGILQILFCFAIASITTYLYIYSTIISTPAIILMVLLLSPFFRTSQYLTALNAFPWIRMHSIIFFSSTNKKVREQSIGICVALIIYFILMYLCYFCITYYLTNLLFNQQMEMNINQLLFGYFAMIQFLSLLFLRTRPFLKFFPIINTIVILCFLFYCKFSPFGFKSIAGICMNCFGLCLFSWMVIHLQIPLLKNIQQNQTFVPNVNQPRGGLIPIFNFSWISSLPEQWTMLMPLRSKQNFNKKELTFINQEYSQLNQYLIQY